jgi:hypothetical protein
MKKYPRRPTRGILSLPGIGKLVKVYEKGEML